MDVVVRKDATFLELLAHEHEELLLGRDALHALDPGLETLNRVGRVYLESDCLLGTQLVVSLIARLARLDEGSVAREIDQTKLLKLRGCEVGPQALERRRERRVHNLGATARPLGHSAPDEHLDEDLHPLMHCRLRRYDDTHDLYELLLEVVPLGHAFDKGSAPLL